jgi:hypothetical protein
MGKMLLAELMSLTAILGHPRLMCVHAKTGLLNLALSSGHSFFFFPNTPST